MSIKLFILILVVMMIPGIGIQDEPNPTFYGEWHGDLWMYWQNKNLNSNQPAYAYYQKTNGENGIIILHFYSHDPNSGMNWWKSDGVILCGDMNVYQIIYSFYQINQIPMEIDRTCTYLPALLN